MVVTRFAPSPTGYLHIGVARTALFSYFFARKSGGKFILRIDDTDRERSKKEYEREIKWSLRWLGVDWDDEIRQSERIKRYMEVAQKLLDEGKAYRCYCSPEELERIRREQLEKLEKAKKEGKKVKVKLGYPGTCRNRKDAPKDRPYAIRFKVPDTDEVVSFDDIVWGRVEAKITSIEDFVLVRTDGTPTYNLASVVDDFDLGVTHVIRGADHITNTHKQILLFRELGRVPQFAHLPLIHGEQGKLSKREGEGVFVRELAEMGFLPEAVVNYLMRLGWSWGDKEIFSRDEILELFSLDRVHRSPAKYDMQKFLWVNSWWMKNIDQNLLFERLKPFLMGCVGPFDREKEEKTRGILPQVVVRTKTLVEATEMILPIFKVKYEEDAVKWISHPKSADILRDTVNLLSSFDGLGEEERKRFEVFIREEAVKLNIKPKEVAQVIRSALYGRTVSPPLFDVIVALGKTESIKRLSEVLKEKGRS